MEYLKNGLKDMNKMKAIDYTDTIRYVETSEPDKVAEYIDNLEQCIKHQKERIQNVLEGKEIPAICVKKYERYEKQLAKKDKEIERLNDKMLIPKCCLHCPNRKINSICCCSLPQYCDEWVDDTPSIRQDTLKLIDIASQMIQETELDKCKKELETYKNALYWACYDMLSTVSSWLDTSKAYPTIESLMQDYVKQAKENKDLGLDPTKETKNDNTTTDKN